MDLHIEFRVSRFCMHSFGLFVDTHTSSTQRGYDEDRADARPPQKTPG